MHRAISNRRAHQRRICDKDWAEIEKIAGAQFSKRVQHLITKLQKKGVDPLGFGLRYRALGHVTDQEWKQWLELYPNLKIDANVIVNIISTGVVK